MHKILSNPIATVVFGLVIGGFILYQARQSNLPVLSLSARGFSG